MWLKEIDNTVERIAITFSRFAGGNFSHFAHFICDFILPFHSLLKKHNLLELVQDKGLIVEIKDARKRHLGPLTALAKELFPNLEIEYVSKFSREPMRCFQHHKWHNDPKVVDAFLDWFKSIYPLTPHHYGVVMVQRGTDRSKYPATNFITRAGADRRSIGDGFDELVSEVKGKRSDTISVILEQMTFRDQVSLFVNADTLIGQHGAAFAHGLWMPPKSHLIEFQNMNAHQCPAFPKTIAEIRGHQLSVVDYPCEDIDGRIVMNIDDLDKVTKLVKTCA